MSSRGRYSLDPGERARTGNEVPPSAFRSNRMSLDNSRFASPSRWSSASSSSPQYQEEPEDFRARSTRYSMGDPSPSSTLSRSSSIRSTAGRVAEVGLGRRSTMLDRGLERIGLHLGRRAPTEQQESPYRSQSRYMPSESSQRRSLVGYDTLERQRSIRNSPESQIPYRPASRAESYARTSTPTASLNSDGRYSIAPKRESVFTSTPSRYEHENGDRYSIARDRTRERPVRVSPGRSVSNSTVRDYDEATRDDTMVSNSTYRPEKGYSRRGTPEGSRKYVAETRSEVFSRPAPLDERRMGNPLRDEEMPVDEKVGMWVREGSVRVGSDDSAVKRRAALPTEFRNDVATPTRSTTGRTMNQSQSMYVTPYRSSSSASVHSSVDRQMSDNAEPRDGLQSRREGRNIRDSTSPSGSMLSMSSRVTGTSRVGQGSSATDGSRRRSAMIDGRSPSVMSGSVYGDSDLAENRRRRKELLEESARQTPSRAAQFTPSRSSTFDGASHTLGTHRNLISESMHFASEPRPSSRMSSIRPSTSMSQLRDLDEPRSAPAHMRLHRQSMVFSNLGEKDGVEGLPDSPLARYHHRSSVGTGSGTMTSRSSGQLGGSGGRASNLNLVRASSPTRSVLSHIASGNPSTKGTPSKIGMARIQARLMKTRNATSKGMLEACIGLITDLNARARDQEEGDELNRSALAKSVRAVATCSEGLPDQTASILSWVQDATKGIDHWMDDRDMDEVEGDLAAMVWNVHGILTNLEKEVRTLKKDGEDVVKGLEGMFELLRGYDIEHTPAQEARHEIVEETASETSEADATPRAGSVNAFVDESTAEQEESSRSETDQNLQDHVDEVVQENGTIPFPTSSDLGPDQEAVDKPESPVPTSVSTLDVQAAPRVPSSPSQLSIGRRSIRSRKSSSTSILSFKPATPTTALSQVSAQSDVKGMIREDEIEGLATREEIDKEGDYFAHKDHADKDEQGPGETHEPRPRLFSASDSLREIRESR